MLNIILIIAAICVVFQTILWIQQVVTKNATAVDFGWAFGITLSCSYALLALETPSYKGVIALALGLLWSMRLAFHILTHRVLRAKEEDGRYKALREHWGEKANLYFFGFYLFQALLSIGFTAPMVALLFDNRPLSFLDLLGIIIWGIAVGGETTADNQLENFRCRPESKGKTCREGLWYYSRHPNYFFEWLQWWAYLIMALGGPYAYWLLIPQALMLLFLFKITGIPYTEMQAVKSRGDDYREYQRTTSVFVPWFPKK